MPDLNVEFDVPASMRDGATLRANILRPSELTASDASYPVILLRTPYDKNMSTTTSWLDSVRLARSGYIVVIQDVRGRFASDGEFGFMDSSAEANDGYDTVEWAARLPGANGKVGMAGSSYAGDVQWAAASQQPPHLRAIMPMVINDDPCNGRVWRNGAYELGSRTHWLVNTIAFNYTKRRLAGAPAAELQQAFAAIAAVGDGLPAAGFWSLPLGELAPLKELGIPLDVLKRGFDRAAFAPRAVRAFYRQVRVPAYNLGGWYDIFGQGTLNNFRYLRNDGSTPEARQSKLLVGPWTHWVQSNVVGDVDFGLRAGSGFVDLSFDMTALAQRWFDHWLKGIDTGITNEPPVKLFIMGANCWRSEQEWPLARTQYTPFYLHSAGRANTLLGDGVLSADAPAIEASDRYVYDPLNPVRTLGGAMMFSPTFGQGAKDQRPIEQRQDVLVYSSAPLQQDIEVTGPVTVALWAASDAADTDFVARLVDVHPDGFAQNLTDGIIRARYRNGDAEELLEPGKAYKFTIDLWSTANVFKRGHRIRLDVTSSNFPRWDRNPNTGHPFGADAMTRPAVQTILHDSEHPSQVILPVIPA